MKPKILPCAVHGCEASLMVMADPLANHCRFVCIPHLDLAREDLKGLVGEAQSLSTRLLVQFNQLYPACSAAERYWMLYERSIIRARRRVAALIQDLNRRALN